MKLARQLRGCIRSCGVYVFKQKQPLLCGGLDVLAALQGTFSAGGLRCSYGECVALPPGHETELDPSGACAVLALSLSPVAVLDLCGDAALAAPPRLLPPDAFSPLCELARLRLADGGDLALASCLLRLLDALSGTPPQREEERGSSRQERLFLQVCDYLRGHLDERPGLSAAAKRFSITPQYLAFLFQKFESQTCSAHFRELERQQEALRERYAALPDAQDGLPDPLGAGEALPYLREPAAGRPQAAQDGEYTVVEADASLGRPAPAFWNRLINLGYAPDLSAHSIFPQLVKAQEEIGFAYGRICRLFDLASPSVAGGRTIYDYNQIFQILDGMIEHRMLPFIELSNKLFRIQLSASENIPKNLTGGTVAYFERLLALLPDFVRACINRYGSACFDQWRFEISYTVYDYLELDEQFSLAKYAGYFRRIKGILREYSRCKVGGPGFNQWNDPRSLGRIYDMLKSVSTAPDFFTAYIYPLTSDGPDAGISANENLAIERMAEIRRVARTLDPAAELWVTEFNSNLSSRNLLNDSSFQSCFLAKVLTAAYALDVGAIGYYMLSDVSLRYLDSLDLLFGGWGLLTDRGLPKPSYHAYRLFSMLGPRLLAQGERYLITAGTGASYRLLFCHYEHISQRYAAKNVRAGDFTDAGQLFLPAPADRWEIRLSGAVPGTYLVREYTVSPTQGSLLALWRQVGLLNLSLDESLAALGKASSLTPRLSTLTVGADGLLRYRAALTGREVRAVVLECTSPPPIYDVEESR